MNHRNNAARIICTFTATLLSACGPPLQVPDGPTAPTTASTNPSSDPETTPAVEETEPSLSEDCFSDDVITECETVPPEAPPDYYEVYPMAGIVEDDAQLAAATDAAVTVTAALMGGMDCVRPNIFATCTEDARTGLADLFVQGAPIPPSPFPNATSIKLTGGPEATLSTFNGNDATFDVFAPFEAETTDGRIFTKGVVWSVTLTYLTEPHLESETPPEGLPATGEPSEPLSGSWFVKSAVFLSTYPLPTDGGE